MPPDAEMADPPLFDSPSAPSSPELENPPRRKLAQHQVRTIALLTRANQYLSDQQPARACQFYTKVLNNLSSAGHPCAFLNRCLCYLVLGFPSLAVADAYRALQGVEVALGDVPGLFLDGILWFSAATRDLIDAGQAEWATGSGQFVGRGKIKWLDGMFTSLAVTDKKRFKLASRDLCVEVWVQAIYRLALSLWRCGGGAMRSALEIIADAKAEMGNFRRHEKSEFDRLEEAILDQLMMEKKEFMNMGLDDDESKEIRKARSDEFDKLIEMRFTRIKKEVYPWDFFTVADDDLRLALQELNEDKGLEDTRCQFDALQSSVKSPTLVLQAKEDIKNQSELFVETRVLTAWSVEGPLERLDDWHHCEYCGASVASATLAYRPTQTPPGTSNFEFQMCPKCAKGTEVFYCSHECSLNACSYHPMLCGRGLEQYIRNVILPYSWPGLPSPHDQRLLLQLFSKVLASYLLDPKHESGECPHILDTRSVRLLNGDFAKSKDLPQEPEGIPRKLDELEANFAVPSISSLFPEAYIIAPPAGQTENIPHMAWSYDTHVRLPFHILQTLDGASCAFDVANFEPWAIYTVLAKIEHSMVVTRGARIEDMYSTGHAKPCTAPRSPSQLDNQIEYAKVLLTERREDGDLTALDPDEVTWSEWEPWVGSLGVMAALVQIENREEQEEAGGGGGEQGVEGTGVNVVLEDRKTRLVCRCIDDVNSSEDATDRMEIDERVLIRKGEILRRGTKVRVLGAEHTAEEKSK